MTRPAELRALTSVRGIAAWMVVLYHIRTSADWLSPTWLAILGNGYLAVDFFFLLSGFVIWMTWHERLPEAGWRGVPRFLQKRIARIWPLHFAMLVFAFGLAMLLMGTGRSAAGNFPLADLPFHILLIQDWGFVNALQWNDPAWSISAELGAYLMFPLLVMTFDWRRVPTPVILTAIAALSIATGIFFAYSGVPKLGDDISHTGLVRCLIEFAMGTAVCALWLRWRDDEEVTLLTIGAAAVGVVVLLLPTAEAYRVPAGFAALLLALALSAGARGHPLEARAIHWLGKISYATYLSHFLLWIAFKLVFVSNSDAVPPGAVAAYLLLVLSASALLYHGLERPAQRWINRLPLARSPARSEPVRLRQEPPPAP